MSDEIKKCERRAFICALILFLAAFSFLYAVAAVLDANPYCVY